MMTGIGLGFGGIGLKSSSSNPLIEPLFGHSRCDSNAQPSD